MVTLGIGSGGDWERQVKHHHRLALVTLPLPLTLDTAAAADTRSVHSLSWLSQFWPWVLSRSEFTYINRNYNRKISLNQLSHKLLIKETSFNCFKPACVQLLKSTVLFSFTKNMFTKNFIFSILCTINFEDYRDKYLDMSIYTILSSKYVECQKTFTCLCLWYTYLFYLK